MPGVGSQCCNTICQCTYSTDITPQKYPSIISLSFISACICLSFILSSVSRPIHLFIHRYKQENIRLAFEASDHFTRQHPSSSRTSLKLLHQLDQIFWLQFAQITRLTCTNKPPATPKGVWYTCQHFLFNDFFACIQSQGNHKHIVFGALLGNILTFSSSCLH